jgi:hypothetical protein
MDFRSNLLARVLATIAALFIIACTATTEYVKRPFVPIQRECFDKNLVGSGQCSPKFGPDTTNVQVLYSRPCLDADLITALIKTDPEFLTIQGQAPLAADLKQIFDRPRIACPLSQTLELPQIPPVPAYSHSGEQLMNRVQDQNKGLLADEKPDWYDIGRGWDNFWLELDENALRRSNEVSANVPAADSPIPLDSLGQLSMSARNAPADAKAAVAGEGIGALPERAQAALINFSSQVRGKDDPSKAATDLLAALVPKKSAPFSSSQKVELTISNALSSASEADRFQYLASYLLIPPLPGPPNSRISLNRQFALKYKRCVISAPPEDRGDPHLQTKCAQLALEGMMVWIEGVDTLATSVANVTLGSLQTNTSITPSIGTPPTAPAAGSVSATFSGQRTENLALQLDQRSTWISPDRTMIRTTQRGIEEATIAGSIPLTVTLHIPTATLYAISTAEDSDTETDGAGGLVTKATFRFTNSNDRRCHKLSPTKLALERIDQPMYSEVDVIDMMVGTARIARPGGFMNFWNHYKKEPSGIAYTKVSGPNLLPLWKHERGTMVLEVDDLLQAEANPPCTDCRPEDRRRALGIWQESPILVRQIAITQDAESGQKFIVALKTHQLGLEPTGSAGWYSVVDCATWRYKPASQQPTGRDHPAADEIWLGQESEKGGTIEAFGGPTSSGFDQLKCPDTSPCPTPTATRAPKPRRTPTATPTPK